MRDTIELKPVNDEAGWTGSELAKTTSWLNVLTSDEISALTEMAESIRPKLNNDANELLALSRQDFDLGAFEPRLRAIFSELRDGKGLSLIRGLPINDMPLLDVATIYWGIGLHLGEATANNPDGDMLGHITDLGKTQSDPNSRGYQTREAMDYHCDQCDIVGLICLRTAKSGGESKVASSITMYNQLLEHHPDYARVLTSPMYWTKHGEHAPDEQPFYTSPVFNFLEGKLCTSFGPKHILKGHNLPGAPDLTQIQSDAIRVAEETANQHRYDMILEPGDIQFLNNYVALHTRSAYTDHDDPSMKRLLWRLWLMNPDLRPRTGYTQHWLNGVGLGSEHHQIRL